MFACSSCDRRLRRARNACGLYWVCTSCKGRAVTVSALRRAVARQYVDQLWVRAWKNDGTTGRSCPACRHLAVEVTVNAEDSTTRLDVCTRCQLVWFDDPEFEGARAVLPKNDPRLAREARRAQAEYELHKMAERAGDTAAPEAWWKYIPGLFGLPVERSAIGLRSYPWDTWTLAVATAVVSVLAFAHLASLAAEFGLVPARAWTHGGLTLLTSFFIHAGWIHLIGNLYFLMVFGDNVEDYLGHGRYLLLIVFATVVGGLCHIAGDPSSMIPAIGASGGISGIITFYALRFPRAQLGFLWRYFLYFRWVTIPAYIALLLWMLVQAVGAWLQIKGMSNISYLAHLGGGGAGLLCWWAWRKG